MESDLTPEEHVDHIVRDHAEIADLVARLRAALERGDHDEMKSLLMALQMVEAKHYATEEALMRAVGYAQADTHRAEHANMLETLKRILPPEKEMPDLMRRVQYLAAQSSLGIRKFNPAQTSQKEFYVEVPITIDLVGTYHNLGAFFDRISRMSRLVNMGNIKVKAQNKPTINNTIAVSATATTYVYQEPPPAPAGPQPGARGRR